MAIQYHLVDNKLTKEPGDYMAKVTKMRTLDLQGIIDEIVERGSTITRPDLLSVMDDFTAVLIKALSEGSAITTPFANFSISIKGVFNGATDDYDPARHQIMPNVNPGRALRARFRGNLAVEKQKTVEPAPGLLKLIDHTTGEVNSLLTSGGMVSIEGHSLKFDSADPKQGIFLIAEDSTEIKIEILGQVMPSLLMFELPSNVGPGEYTVVVRTRPGKKLVEGSLKSVVSVLEINTTQRSA